MGRDRNFVNLDALLPRADLFEQSEAQIADSPSIRVVDLEAGLTYNLLRKPDFQRETANWSPDQVATLIKTFCDADIIPSVILWQNGGQVFVVDGAHRLSALIAWVRNDYGAGALSAQLYRGSIPDHQREMHKQTAEKVNSTVGPWEEYKTKHSVMALKAIEVQWIRGSSPSQAANAFIRINQGGTVIDGVEVRILQAARSALSIATRVIARGGEGHQYWNYFTDLEAKKNVPELGAKIYRLLYHPALQTPIKSPDTVPLAGYGYGASVLRFAFDLVALANDLTVADSSRKPKTGEVMMPGDGDGNSTLNYLRRVRRALELLLSNEPCSLGLHPLLYFYSASGSFQTAAFLNILAWVKRLDHRNKLDSFRHVRGRFEDLVLAHPIIIRPSSNKLGSGSRTRKRMLDLLDRAVALLAKTDDTNKVWETLKEEFPTLRAEETDAMPEEAAPGLDFSAGAKSALTYGDLASAPRCELCDGLLHINGKVVDHVEKKAEGGGSSSTNGRWVHPICNSNRDKDAGQV